MKDDNKFTSVLYRRLRPDLKITDGFSEEQFEKYIRRIIDKTLMEYFSKPIRELFPLIR